MDSLIILIPYSLQFKLPEIDTIYVSNIFEAQAIAEKFTLSLSKIKVSSWRNS